MPADAGLAVTALSYQYAAKDTPTSNGKITLNFPLTISGTDIASGQAYEYRYDASSQMVTLVPEPTGAALSLAAALALAFGRRQRRQRNSLL
jgi:MYXO-CTERM domain-containing protein